MDFSPKRGACFERADLLTPNFCTFHQLLKHLTDGVTLSYDTRPEVVEKNQTILLNLGIDKPVRRLLNLHLARDTSRRDSGELEADIPLNIPRRDLFQV